MKDELIKLGLNTERMNPEFMPDSRHLELRIAEEVNHQLIASSGDILVFLPGKKEIVQCEQALAKESRYPSR